MIRNTGKAPPPPPPSPLPPLCISEWTLFNIWVVGFLSPIRFYSCFFIILTHCVITFLRAVIGKGKQQGGLNSILCSIQHMNYATEFVQWSYIYKCHIFDNSYIDMHGITRNLKRRDIILDEVTSRVTLFVVFILLFFVKIYLIAILFWNQFLKSWKFH